MFLRNSYRFTRRYYPLLLLLVGVVVAAVLLQDVFDAAVASLTTYETTRPVSGRLFFVLLAALSVLLGPFTSAALMPFAVGLWGTGETLLLLLFGWVVGGMAAYWIGSTLGYPAVRKVVQPKLLDRWARIVREEADVRLLFLFRLAVPAEIGYVFGILRYDFPMYVAISVAAEIPFALVLVYGGDAFLSGQWPVLVALGGGAIALIAWALHAFNRARRADGKQSVR